MKMKRCRVCGKKEKSDTMFWKKVCNDCYTKIVKDLYG